MASAEKMASKRAARRAAGLCTECDTPALPGRSRCERHDRMLQEHLNTLRAHLNRHNLCYCGAPRAPGRTRCRTCLEIENQKASERYQQRRAAGLCVQCGERKAKAALCGICRRKRHEYHRDQRVADIRRRLWELIERDRIPMPERLRQHARFLLGRMEMVEVDPDLKHWRPQLAACRRYAQERPGWEGFLLVSRQARERVTLQAYLVTREPGARGNERIRVRFIPTSTDAPWRRYG